MNFLKYFTLRSLLYLLISCPAVLAARDSEKTKPASSTDEVNEPAKKLTNPVAILISVPIQLYKDLNLITRNIIPIVTQYNVKGENSSQSGLNDATVSTFLSPANVKNGLVWDSGPVFLIPSASDEYFGRGKSGVGPTIAALKQTHGRAYGLLANQIWALAGHADRAVVSHLLVQPFFIYHWKAAREFVWWAQLCRIGNPGQRFLLLLFPLPASLNSENRLYFLESDHRYLCRDRTKPILDRGLSWS